MEPGDRAESRLRILKHVAQSRPVIEVCPQVTDSNLWRFKILRALGLDIMMNCVEVVEGESRESVWRMAWAARNLLELHYWSRYVLTSDLKARRFYEDFMCDFKNLTSRMAALDERFRHANYQSDALWSQMEQVDDTDRYLRIAEIVDDLGPENHYSICHKFLSKFVHPTSLSILLRLTPGKEPLQATIMNLAASFVDSTLPQVVAALQAQYNTSGTGERAMGQDPR